METIKRGKKSVIDQRHEGPAQEMRNEKYSEIFQR
jgi:hypothetical protein